MVTSRTRFRWALTPFDDQPVHGCPEVPSWTPPARTHAVPLGVLVASFALPDVVTPCVLGGAAIGEPFHELRTVLFVTEVETAFGDDGVVITGAAPRNSTSIDAAAVAGDTARAAPPSWGVSPWAQSSGGLRAGRPSPLELV